MKRTLILASALWAALAASAWSADTITQSNGKRTIGKITAMTATSVTIEPTGRPAQEIGVNEIDFITFESSSPALTTAQKAIHDGNYAEALNSLKNESGESTRREISEEVAFSKAFCAAQLAMAGEENADPVDAGRQLLTFLNNSPNSYHYLKACELVGDMLVSAGRFPKAQEYYAKLAQAPWPDYKIRAQVALGRAYLAGDKLDEAAKAFREAQRVEAAGPLADLQRTAAKIGQARCLALTGQTDQAIRDIEQVLNQNSGDETGRNPEITAMAYNALGTALRKSGKPKEAILAFLRVHLQYSTNPDLHAEAVANLAKLFAETQKPNHAGEMRGILQDHYQRSRWAQPGAVK